MEQQHGIFIRFASSVPMAGPALAIFLEHVQMGISRYGIFFGLLSGAFMGLLIAVGLMAISEAVIATFDVGREWIAVNITSDLKTKIRVDAVDRWEAAHTPPSPHRVEKHYVSATRPDVVNYYTPFVRTDDTKEAYEATLSTEMGLERLKTMTRAFFTIKANVADGMTYDGQADLLPEGTVYRPYLRNHDDPKSVIEIGVFDGHDMKFIPVTVTLGSVQRFGLIPKFEYDCFLKGMGE